MHRPNENTVPLSDPKKMTNNTCLLLGDTFAYLPLVTTQERLCLLWN